MPLNVILPQGAGGQNYAFNSSLIPVQYWINIPLTFTQLSAASTTGTATVYTATANQTIHAANMSVTTPFTGGSISAYTVSLGIGGATTRYMTAKDVFTAAAVFDGAAIAPNLLSVSTTTAVIATATSTSANTNAATAGAATVWLLVSDMPTVPGV